MLQSERVDSEIGLQAIRPNSLVQLRRGIMTDYEKRNIPAFFYDGTPVVFIGEIVNMPGHGIYACNGRKLLGYKMSLFVELNEDEVYNLKFE